MTWLLHTCSYIHAYINHAYVRMYIHMQMHYFTSRTSITKRLRAAAHTKTIAFCPRAAFACFCFGVLGLTVERCSTISCAARVRMLES